MTALAPLAGHDSAWAAWRRARADGRMHHAWLLAGREGLGKASFALAAAVELVAEPGVPQPDPMRHPDILIVRPLPANDDEAKKAAEGRPFLTKRNIAVDQIRQIQRRLVTRPTLGSHRVVIIDAADQLEKGAVNALLKSLEEPPQGTVFMLVAHQPGRLLPTIRSRCRLVRFQPLDDATMGQVLARLAPELDAEARAAAVVVGQGAPGAALAFAEADLAGAVTLMQRIVNHGDAGLALRAGLTGALGGRPDRDRLVAAINAAREVLARALPDLPRARQAAAIEAHVRLTTLAAEAPIFNYDPALLLAQIGGELAKVAPEPVD